MKKKVFALTIALTMLIALALPIGASAAQPGAPFSITINAPTSLSIEDQTFTAFKVFDVTYNPAGTTYTYTTHSAFAGFEDYETFPTQTLDEYVRGLQSNQPAINALAGRLYMYAQGRAGVVSASAVAAAPGRSVTIPLTQDGYYMVHGTGHYTEDGDTSYIAAVMLTTVDREVAVTLKADAPTVPKESVGPDEQEGVNVGDTLTYYLYPSVPNRAGYDNYMFQVWDTMSPGLTLNENVKVHIGGVRGVGGFNAVVGTDYTITYANNGFMIDFLWARFQTYETGAEIWIEYTALVNQDAVEKVANHAWLKYSNNPGDFEDYEETPPTIVPDPTFAFEIDKFDSTDSEVKLAGARFTLHKGPHNATVLGDQIQFVLINAGSATARAEYVVATNDTIKQGDVLVNEIVTPESGLIYVRGLAAGLYALTETAAPGGYNIGGPWTIPILSTATATVEFEVPNVPSGGMFPGTGGTGTTIFYIVGALVMAGAVVTLIVRKKVAVK